MSAFPDLNMTVEEAMESELASSGLSAPSVVLLVIAFVTAVSGSLYVASFPLPFAADFGIDSEVGGYLDAAANVFSFLVLSVFLKYSSSSKLCRYPFDILVIALVFAIGNILFIVFYAEWIAYSVHWVIRRISIVVMGCEMVSRLYLCPPAAFNKVTSIGGMLKTIGYLTGATIGPLLFTASHKLPFIVMAALNLILIAIVSAVYFYRITLIQKEMRSHFIIDDDDDGIDTQTMNNYLLLERAWNNKKHSEKQQKIDKLHVQQITRIVRHSVTASDVLSIK